MSRVARRLVVTGRVQGVFFRASMRDRARDAGVVGWVRNRPDGAVEAHVEGTPEAVDAVQSWARDGGPPDAVVDAVEVEEVDPAGGGVFEIAR